MHTFEFRDRRLDKVTAALAMAGDEAPELRAALDKELAALSSDDWRVTDRSYLLAAEDFLWVTTLTLKLSVEEDPALKALGENAQLTDAQAAAVETLPRVPGGPPADFLEQVRTAVGNDESVWTELVHTAHRVRLIQPGEAAEYLYDDVGVVMPVRLETFFQPPAAEAAPWTIYVRVIPDDASIRRDNTQAQAQEVVCLREFWQWEYVDAAGIAHRADVTVSPTDWLDSDGGKVAWAELCNRVGAARAAWLVAEFPPSIDVDKFEIDAPAGRIGPGVENRVAGFPSTLEVRITQGTQDSLIGTLEVKPAKLLLPLPEAVDSWLTSWDEAVEVGMGGKWALPDGITPENIDALYVIGIDDESPDELFLAHASSGELGAVELGAPTNTAHGDAAADLAKDGSGWRETAAERLKRSLDMPIAVPRIIRKLSRAMLSRDAVLPAFPGSAGRDDAEDSINLCRALWPALWGHWLHGIWEMTDDTLLLMRWLTDHFYPEGPLMPIRIGDQPYGLLPVTALSQWQVEPAADPIVIRMRQLEEGMARTLTRLRREWAAAAERAGTVVGQPTEKFFDLLSRGAASHDYIVRFFLPYHVLADIYQQFGPQRDQFHDRALEFFRPAMEVLERRPGIPFLAAGYPSDVSLPLVQPTRMPEARSVDGEITPYKVDEILTGIFQGLDLETIFHRERRKYILPDSLLIRLMVYASQLAQPWRHQLIGQNIDFRIFDAQEKFAREFAREFDQNVEVKRSRSGQRFVASSLAAKRVDQLERAVRATLDSAAHRIDPWITGLVWQRWAAQADSPRKNPRLAVYGWVDGPFIGTPGPTESGRLHAPSNAQAIAALILRDKFLSARNGPDAENNLNPWAMNLDSRKVRLAEEIAEEARMGFHIDDIVGRRVEAIVETHGKIRKLRTDSRFALRPTRKDPNEVCNGRAALKGLLNPQQRLIALSAAQRKKLQLLSDALDAYADLLIADAAMQLVNRQTGRAAELMDAAAGFSRPPTFEFTRTPPSGYQLETRVLTALPFIPLAALGPDAAPIAVADPSIASFIEARLGNAWTWKSDAGDVSLGDLGLTPLGAIALPDALLQDAARARLETPDAVIEAPEAYRLARQFAAQLGTQPLISRDLTASLNSPGDRAIDQAIYAELVARFQRLAADCQATIDALDQAATTADRTTALRAALRWGIAPVADPMDRAIYLSSLFAGAPGPDADIERLAKAARESLEARLAAAPDPTTLLANVTDPPKTGPKTSAPDGIPRMARAIAELASTDGKISVLAIWNKDVVLNLSQLKTDAPDSKLDADWLSLVAPVRPPLARLEALQLEARELELFEPFACWSSSPDDHWQKQIVAANLASDVLPNKFKLPPFSAAYGDGDAWAGESVAVGLIDSFSEAIPLPERGTTVAFGFNAPAARAQQAILLAVPPKVRQRIDRQLLFQIVRETRELAHARAATLDDLGKYSSLLPTMWLKATDPPRMRMEPWPLFT